MDYQRAYIEPGAVGSAWQNRLKVLQQENSPEQQNLLLPRRNGEDGER